MWAFRRADASQFLQQNRACAEIGVLVIKQLMRPVRSHGDAVDLKGQTCGIDFGVEVAGFLGFADGARDGANPLVHDGRDTVAHNAAPAVGLEAGSAKETASLENPLFNQSQPILEQAPEAGHPSGRGDGRSRDLFYENLAGELDGRSLKVFLGTKMREETTLAHF